MRIRMPVHGWVDVSFKRVSNNYVVTVAKGDKKAAHLYKCRKCASARMAGLNALRCIPPENLFHFGSISDIRISKGVARWTANFTPPTEKLTKP